MIEASPPAENPYQLTASFNPHAYEREIMAKAGETMKTWLPAQFEWKSKFFEEEYKKLIGKSDHTFYNQVNYAFEKYLVIPYISNGTSPIRQLSEIWNHLNTPERYPITPDELAVKAEGVWEAVKGLFQGIQGNPGLMDAMQKSKDDIIYALLQTYSEHRVYTKSYYDKKGIRTIPLYRGFYFDNSGLRQCFMAGETISRGSFEAWTPYFEVAKKFADNISIANGFVVKKEVPVENIFVSCELFADLSIKNEREFLVDALYSVTPDEIVYLRE